jgi:hypothetical protein
LNTEKGDSLLLAIPTSGGTVLNYFTWELRELPPYPLAFLQFIDGDPVIEGTNSREASISHTISIIAIMCDDGSTNMPKLKERYNRLMRSIVFSEVSKKGYFSATGGLANIYVNMLDEAGDKLYVTSGITFNVITTL